MEHHDLKGGTPKTFATSVCIADTREASTTAPLPICRNTGGAACLLLVFMKVGYQPTPPSYPYLGLRHPHKYSVITAVAGTLVALA